VQHQQPQAARELQHFDIAVGIARGQDRPAPDPAPQPHRFHRPIVEEFRLRSREQMTVPVVQPHRASDHPLWRNPVQRTGDRAHEVTPAAGDDVTHEGSCLEIPQQLDHRAVPARGVGPLQRRVFGIGEEGFDPAAVFVDSDRFMSGEHCRHQGRDVGVIALIVLGDGIAQPLQVALERRLVRLFVPQRRVGLGLRSESAHQEVELDVHRLLAPQRAVVVEDRDTLVRLNVIRSTVGGDPTDEVDDRRLRGSVIPRLEHLVLSERLVQLLHRLVDRERRRLLSRRELLERLQELRHNRARIEQEEDVVDHPVVVRV
jgi:hypothetical protein